jgi:hypothetical protein
METTQTPLMDSLKATDPEMFRRLMDRLTEQVVCGVAHELKIQPRTARAALRTTGRI